MKVFQATISFNVQKHTHTQNVQGTLYTVFGHIKAELWAGGSYKPQEQCPLK